MCDSMTSNRTCDEPIMGKLRRWPGRVLWAADGGKPAY